MKGSLVAFVAIGVAFQVRAATGTAGGYTYNYLDNGNGTVTISRYDENWNYVMDCISPEPDGEFAFPETIDGKSVVAIFGNVLMGNATKSVTVPACISQMSNVFLSAFGLTNITVASANTAYKSVDGLVYTKDGKTLVSCPRAKSGSIVIAPGTECVGVNAMFGNDKFSSISIPTGVRTIEESAFRYSTGDVFASVTIPASVETIEQFAFSGCENLATVTFDGDESAIDIHPTAFAGTRYDANKPFSLIVEDGELIGFHGTAPESFIIANYLSSGQTLNAIGSDALSGDVFDTQAMKSVVIPNGVTLIDTYAFYYSTALASVSLPDSLQAINAYAFSGCSALRTLRIPPGVSYVDDLAFDECENLTVYAPETLRNAFYVPDECTIEYYEMPHFTATLYANGGSFGGAPSKQVPVFDGYTIASLVVPTYEGRLFAGWYTSALGGQRQSLSAAIASDITLYAHWTASPFSATGGDAAWIAEVDGSWRSGIIRDSQSSRAEFSITNAPCKVLFKWRVSSEGGWDKLHCYIDGEEATFAISGIKLEWIPVELFIYDSDAHLITFEYEKDAETSYGEDCGWISDFTIVSGQIHTVVFDANGGSFEADDRHVVHGQIVGDLPEPTLQGYIFLGWFTALQGGSKVTAQTQVLFDLSLYAHWQAVAYNYSYRNNGDGTVTLTGISPAPSGALTLPDEIDGMQVVAIGNNVLAGGELTSVVIPASVTNLTTDVFDAAWNLKFIQVVHGNDHYMSADGIVYTKDMTRLVVCPRGFSGTATVVYGTKYIGAGAFTGVQNMDKLELPASLLVIEDKAFVHCYSLASASFPASVTNIGDSAFELCENLRTVFFQGGDDEINGYDRIDSIEVNLASAFVSTPWLDIYILNHEPPENDCFASATVIVGSSGIVSGSNMGAGIEEGEPLRDFADSTATVWWKWTAPARGVVSFTTIGSDFNAAMGIYTGNSVGALTVVAENAYGNLDGTSTNSFEAVNGTTYYIAVGGKYYGLGKIVLAWSQEAEIGNATVDLGGGKSLEIPGDWLDIHATVIDSRFGGDRGTYAVSLAANGCNRVWECYVLGLDPESENAVFKITSFELGSNGNPPDLSSVEFSPAQTQWITGARPVLKGASTPTAPWQTVPQGGNSSFRFFKVAVELP